jgi:hypothetical protein
MAGGSAFLCAIPVLQLKMASELGGTGFIHHILSPATFLGPNS